MRTTPAVKTLKTFACAWLWPFPDTYDVGMSYLGQKIYNIVNSEPGWWAERVMAPEKEAAEILRAHNTPLATLESDTPLASMHCLSFSITHELCYTNVLYMLDLAGIPCVWKTGRRASPNAHWS